MATSYSIIYLHMQEGISNSRVADTLIPLLTMYIFRPSIQPNLGIPCTIFPPPANNSLLATRYSSILSTCPNHLKTLWSTLVARSLWTFLFQLFYTHLHSWLYYCMLGTSGPEWQHRQCSELMFQRSRNYIPLTALLIFSAHLYVQVARRRYCLINGGGNRQSIGYTLTTALSVAGSGRLQLGRPLQGEVAHWATSLSLLQVVDSMWY